MAAVQMIGFNGDFCETEKVREFIRGLAPANQNITVVSIIGSQSSGKSTLLNHLFGTDFEVMDPNENNGQTTEGIWIAKCRNNPLMVIMDVEGFDSAIREENGRSFDYRAALFALTISDVLLLNMNACDLGKDNGGCGPLLKTIFQERVSLPPGKTRVVVTLRDCKNLTNTRDEDTANKIIEKSWKSCPNTIGRLEDYVEVSVKQFPNAKNESRSKEFQMKLAELREQLTPAGLRPPQNSSLTTATFLNKVHQIWAKISTIEDLDIPSFNVCQSRDRCQKINIAILSSLDSNRNKDFPELINMQGSTSPTVFKRNLDNFLLSTFKQYDSEAAGCTEQVRNDYKARLKKEIMTKLVGTFSRILNTKKDEIVEENKVKISNHLRRTKKGHRASIVDSIVNPYVTKFDDLFRDCCEEYKEQVSIFSRELNTALKEYAEQEIKNIGSNFCCCFNPCVGVSKYKQQ